MLIDTILNNRALTIQSSFIMIAFSLYSIKNNKILSFSVGILIHQLVCNVCEAVACMRMRKYVCM